MTHTVDTLMALAYKIRDARTYEWDVSEAVEAGNALRAALTDALAPQPVRDPCKTLCELCVKRGYSGCANTAQTTPIVVAQPVREQDAALLRKTLDVLDGAEQMNSARPDKFEIELTAEQIDSLATEIRARLNGAQPVREPLTQNEIYELFRQHLYVSDVDQYSIHGAWEFAKAIEKAHNIGCDK